MSQAPTLAAENALLASGARLVAGMDEVGRGALAGPVCVGVVVVSAPCVAIPASLRDSKDLTPGARSALLAPLSAWCAAYATGWASPLEIDQWGIVAALRAAGRRALAALGLDVDVVLLDGKHDWLSGSADDGGSGGRTCVPPLMAGQVLTRVKADRDCASVAAASVFAKCARDSELTRAAGAHPGYGWEANKGYGTAAHVEAIAQRGISPYHRASWRLAGGGA